MAGEMLEHRKHSGLPQTLRVGPGVGGDLIRIRTERPVPDHAVVRGVGDDIDHRGEVDGNAQRRASS